MKNFINSYLIDVVDDAETGLTKSQIDDATEYIYWAYDCTEMYEQIDRLLTAYLATQSKSNS